MSRHISRIISLRSVTFSIILFYTVGMGCSKAYFHGSNIEKLLLAEEYITRGLQEYVISLERRMVLAKK